MRALVPTDAAIAALCNGIYDYPGYAPVVWDHLEEPRTDAGICWGLKRVGDVDVVVLRGSTTLQDWLLDVDALAMPLWRDRILEKIGFTLSQAAQDHLALGPVHPGFLAGMEDAFAAMRPMLGGTVVLAGHSLGAGRAAILTGLMVHAGKSPVACVTFGQPRPGFPPLAKLVEGVPQRSYRNGNGILYDLITDVPVALGLENYVHPWPLTDICEEPTGTLFARWGPFDWHGMPLYLRALEKQAGLPLSGPADMACMPGAPKRHPAIH